MVEVKTFNKYSISEKLARKLTGIEGIDKEISIKIKKRAIKFVQNEFDKMERKIKDLETENELLKSILDKK